jgi:hypothetical protein
MVLHGHRVRGTGHESCQRTVSGLSLATQFEVIAHNLSECQHPDQRRELLKGMILVLEQMADLCMNEHSLTSKSDTITFLQPAIKQGRAHQ